MTTKKVRIDWFHQRVDNSQKQSSKILWNMCTDDQHEILNRRKHVGLCAVASAYLSNGYSKLSNARKNLDNVFKFSEATENCYCSANIEIELYGLLQDMPTSSGNFQHPYFQSKKKENSSFCLLLTHTLQQIRQQ